MTDTADITDIIASVAHEVELARRRALEALIDSATPYIGIVEEVSADGGTIRVRKVEEVPGSGRWVARPAGHRPAVGAQLPIILTTGLNARGQLETVGIAGTPLGGDFTGGFGVGGRLDVETPTGASQVRIGRYNSADTPVLDFDSSAYANGVDARVTATGGTAAPLGGNLHLQAAAVYHNGLPVWDTTSATAAVNGSHLVDDAVNRRHLATDAVGGNEIASAVVDTQHLAPDAIATSKIAAGAVTPVKLDRAYSVPGHDHDARYYTQGTSDGRYAGAAHLHAGVYAPAVHTHDDRYYTAATADTRYLSKTAALDHNGTSAGFMGAAPVTRRAAPAVQATDGTASNAALATAINTLRAGLINLGLFG